MTDYDLSNLVAELKVTRTPVPGRAGGYQREEEEYPQPVSPQVQFVRV